MSIYFKEYLSDCDSEWIDHIIETKDIEFIMQCWLLIFSRAKHFTETHIDMFKAVLNYYTDSTKMLSVILSDVITNSSVMRRIDHQIIKGYISKNLEHITKDDLASIDLDKFDKIFDLDELKSNYKILSEFRKLHDEAPAKKLTTYAKKFIDGLPNILPQIFDQQVEIIKNNFTGIFDECLYINGKLADEVLIYKTEDRSGKEIYQIFDQNRLMNLSSLAEYKFYIKGKLGNGSCHLKLYIHNKISSKIVKYINGQPDIKYKKIKPNVGTYAKIKVASAVEVQTEEAKPKVHEVALKMEPILELNQEATRIVTEDVKVEEAKSEIKIEPIIEETRPELRIEPIEIEHSTIEEAIQPVIVENIIEPVIESDIKSKPYDIYYKEYESEMSNALHNFQVQHLSYDQLVDLLLALHNNKNKLISVKEWNIILNTHLNSPISNNKYCFTLVLQENNLEFKKFTGIYQCKHYKNGELLNETIDNVIYQDGQIIEPTINADGNVMVRDTPYSGFYYGVNFINGIADSYMHKHLNVTGLYWLIRNKVLNYSILMRIFRHSYTYSGTFISQFSNPNELTRTITPYREYITPDRCARQDIATLHSFVNNSSIFRHILEQSKWYYAVNIPKSSSVGLGGEIFDNIFLPIKIEILTREELYLENVPLHNITRYINLTEDDIKILILFFMSKIDNIDAKNPYYFINIGFDLTAGLPPIITLEKDSNNAKAIPPNIHRALKNNSKAIYADLSLSNIIFNNLEMQEIFTINPDLRSSLIIQMIINCYTKEEIDSTAFITLMQQSTLLQKRQFFAALLFIGSNAVLGTTGSINTVALFRSILSEMKDDPDSYLQTMLAADNTYNNYVNKFLTLGDSCIHSFCIYYNLKNELTSRPAQLQINSPIISVNQNQEATNLRVVRSIPVNQNQEVHQERSYIFNFFRRLWRRITRFFSRRHHREIINV